MSSLKYFKSFLLSATSNKSMIYQNHLNKLTNCFYSTNSLNANQKPVKVNKYNFIIDNFYLNSI